MTARALVTGGCGFVGRHFTRALLDRGYEVTVVDDLSTGLPPERWLVNLQPAKGEPCEVLIGDVRAFMREHAASEFDLVLHLAAVVGGRLTIEGRPLLVATDLSIDADFFNWLASSSPSPRALYFSSSAAYPVSLQTRDHAVRLREDTIDLDGDAVGMPDLTYGWAKLTGELLARHAVQRHGLDVLSFRPFSGYGEDQDLSYPFPSVIRRVIRREVPLTVWGSGLQERDFIHIDDVVEAVFLASDRLDAGAVLNLGWGRATTFIGLATIASELAGMEVEIVVDRSKPEGVFSRVCDPTKLNAFFEAEISLESGVARALEHFSRHPIMEH